MAEAFWIAVILGAMTAPLLLATAAWQDMSRRGEPGWLYGLLVFFFLPFGIAAWLIARAFRPKPTGSSAPS